MRIALLTLATSLLGFGCHSYGGGDVPRFSIALDTHGASNSQCTMTIANGDRHVSFNIAPPNPPVPETSLAPLAPAAECTDLRDDAGATALATSPEGITLTATRTSTGLCASSFDGGLMRQLGFSAEDSNRCPVVVSLSCGGVVLYDRVAWTACIWLG